MSIRRGGVAAPKGPDDHQADRLRTADRSVMLSRKELVTAGWTDGFWVQRPWRFGYLPCEE